MAAVALLAALGAWAFTGLEVRHELRQFLPDAQDREMARIAREMLDSEFSRTIVLALGADEEREAIAAARAVAERLRTEEGVAWVRSGPAPAIDEALHRLYFPRRYAFFAPSADEARAALDDASLRERAARLRRELSGPLSVLIRRIAAEDPLLAFVDRLREIRAAGGGLRVVDGQFVTEDGWALVVLATVASTFETQWTAPLLARIDAIVDDVNAAHGGRIRVERAGLHRFAVRAEREIRSDVQRISILSTIGMIALFWLLYRSPRFLLLGALPLVAGAVVATAVCRLIFGGVHGITFAFGSSLLGVGVDYVAHYVNHQVLDPDPRGAAATMRRLWPALVLGAATTIAGLAGLSWTSLSGMREMAVFASVGVTVALLATRVLVPPWMPEARRAPRMARAAADAFERLWSGMRRRRGAVVVLPAIAIGTAALGIPRLTWIDDLRALNDTDPAMLAEENAVRARLGQGESGRLVIARGETDEEALARADLVAAALERVRARGAIRSYRSIAPLLRSAALQDRVQRAVIEAPDLADRTIAALEAAGFIGTMFEPFRASLVAAEPLRWADLAASPLADLVRPFRAELESGEVAYLAFVEGVEDAAALRAELGGIDGVGYFDRSGFLIDAYRTFRERSIELLAVGLAIVCSMCVIRYRSLRLGVASIAPALLAALTTLGILGLAGESANLMHLVGALLALSMGEDYAVFLLESRDDPRAVATTMVGIAVACATTVLSFGLLALSSHPALRALGTMASLGVLLSLLLSPMVLLAAGGDPRRGPDP